MEWKYGWDEMKREMSRKKKERINQVKLDNNQEKKEKPWITLRSLKSPTLLFWDWMRT